MTEDWRMTEDELRIFNRIDEHIACFHRNVLPYPDGSEPKLKNALIYAIAKELSQMKREVSNVAFFGYNKEMELCRVFPKDKQ